MTEQVSFGDTVMIREAAETKALGIAGKTGTVYGYTTPSVTGVEVVGVAEDDYAVNVHLDDLGEGYWLSEQLVEFLDHGAGMTVSVAGVDRAWVRLEDGGWAEAPAPRATKKPWWRFWG
ncbi:hypothetical protein [Caulobacter sp. 17J80-11]|uniref:hypothetical protein n=1 Tax=Caulobacter sp. 17J80-11 TaxID=2763502 RepID=UPI0016536EE9|nr:hypothetical protein [Caulobacter sp. 17J80-11]MBC6981524.1 hypothetical protein [Caulobacter sp. 17J80-11]